VRMRIAFSLAPVAILVAAVGAGSAPAHASLVPSVGDNHLVDLDHGLAFPQNKQNEQSITRDPQTGVLVAGANDEMSQPLCPGTTTPLSSPCPFKPGAPISAWYRSTDGGATWTGGYLPGFSSIGRSSGGDPSLAVGPRRCADGTFAWSCGVDVYYASLADPFPERGGEAVTVSRSSDDAQSWADPTIVDATVTKGQFDDHEWVAVDNGAGSPRFGRVDVTWAQFCNTCAGNGNVKIFVAHSDDEGATWSKAVQVSATNNNASQGFRETGQMTVASNGTVEDFWTENADAIHQQSVQVVATSSDGGSTFSSPITVSPVVDYPLTGTPFDVVDLFNRVPGMSARVDCFPHPASDPTSSRVVVVWCDFAGGHGTVQGASSSDGLHWTSLGTVATISGRNAFFPEPAIGGDGIVSVGFDALTAPPAGNPFQTGVQTYDVYYVQTTSSGFTAPVRVSGASSNPDPSSYNNLKEQFLGDYIGAVSGPTSTWLAWTDARNATACDAVDSYRASVYAGSKTAVAPNPDSACATSFGNTDTMVAEIAH
jgi:hypothetical protein